MPLRAVSFPRVSAPAAGGDVGVADCDVGLQREHAPIVRPTFDFDDALVCATMAGRELIDCVDDRFLDAARSAIGRDPTSEELWAAVEHHLFQSAMQGRHACRLNGATDGQADALREAFIEGAHAALIALGSGTLQ